MPQGPQSSLRLFRVLGIDVYVHWAWIFVAIFQIQNRAHQYSSMTWNVIEYLTLFLIVLVHEFGHALACRSVGGTANQIMLWPLGGVAYVAPPQRPGAVLWSIAAGPLVNVALLFVLTPITGLIPNPSSGFLNDWDHLLVSVWWINFGLLLFNLLPIYPLDGGQILRALLWFPLGRAHSLFAASILGFVGVAGLAGFAYHESSIWMGIITYFVFLQCANGLKQARALRTLEKMPRRDGFACPSCGATPPIGPIWKCLRCQTPFDIFETQGVCPNCQAQYPDTLCFDCRAKHPIEAWRQGSATSANA